MAFISPVQIHEPLATGPERDVLPSWLDHHRTYLLSKLDGLDEKQAALRLVPSLTTLHGLVRHMAWVEHHWFVRVLGEVKGPGPFEVQGDKDAEWRLETSDGLDADVAVYLAQCERSREVFADLDLDTTRSTPRGHIRDVRWVMIHMIEEYAQHNGHADIIRELTDAKPS